MAASFQVLQQDYNLWTGLWTTTGWWNAANCLTMLANYGLASSSDTGVDAIISHTYNTVSASQIMDGKTARFFGLTTDDKHGIHSNYSIDAKALYLATVPSTAQVANTEAEVSRPHIEVGSSLRSEHFINEFYDDEAWWALAWIRAFDLTGNVTYLITATDIFDDLLEGQRAPCGGIWWNKAHAAEVAITNSLFLETAASLANRQHHLPGQRASHRFIQWALESYLWIIDSGLMDADHLVNDGLTSECQNNNGTKWTYNQGALIAGLVELYHVTSLQVLLDRAHRTAHAAIQHFTDARGILHEPCEASRSCHPDGSQFKGIFLRAIAQLHAVAPRPEYRRFVQRNVASILAADWNDEGQFSLLWSGPFLRPANASTHCAAMDALAAALQLAT